MMLVVVALLVFCCAPALAQVPYTTASLRLPVPTNDTILAVCGTSSDSNDFLGYNGSLVLVLSQTRFMAFQVTVGNCSGLKLCLSSPVLGCNTDNSSYSTPMLRVRQASCYCQVPPNQPSFSPECSIVVIIDDGRVLNFRYGYGITSEVCLTCAWFFNSVKNITTGEVLFAFQAVAPYATVVVQAVYAFAVGSRLDVRMEQSGVEAAPAQNSTIINVATQSPRLFD